MQEFKAKLSKKQQKYVAGISLINGRANINFTNYVERRYCFIWFNADKTCEYFYHFYFTKNVRKGEFKYNGCVPLEFAKIIDEVFNF